MSRDLVAVLGPTFSRCMVIQYIPPDLTPELFADYYRSCLPISGRTLEETAALFDGESVPRDLVMTGGEAATMTMNRSGPQPVSARIAERHRYEKVTAHSPRSSHNSGGFGNGFGFGRGNGAVATDFLELQHQHTPSKDEDVYDHDLRIDGKERIRDSDRSLSPHSRDSDSV